MGSLLIQLCAAPLLRAAGAARPTPSSPEDPCRAALNGVSSVRQLQFQITLMYVICCCALVIYRDRFSSVVVASRAREREAAGSNPAGDISPLFVLNRGLTCGPCWSVALCYCGLAGLSPVGSPARTGRPGGLACISGLVLPESSPRGFFFPFSFSILICFNSKQIQIVSNANATV